MIKEAFHDTIFHFDGFYFFVNSDNIENFDEMRFEDHDNLTPNPEGGIESSEWEFWYNEIAPGDTLSWVQATSWFDPPGQANDWIKFGPLKIPSVGAELTWKNFNNPAYRNGYQILISTNGMDNNTDFNDTIFAVSDLYEANSIGIDTNRLFLDPPKAVEIPAKYNGQPIWIAIHHNANDMDVIHFTDIVLRETNGNSINEHQTQASIKLYQNAPNPAKNKTVISFETTQSGEYDISIYDLTGQLIKKINSFAEGNGLQNITVNTSEMKEGLYFYTLTTGDRKSVV